MSSNAEPPADEMRKCPYCAEMIKAEAVVCRYCNRDITPTVTPDNTAETASPPEPLASEPPASSPAEETPSGKRKPRTLLIVVGVAALVAAIVTITVLALSGGGSDSDNDGSGGRPAHCKTMPDRLECGGKGQALEPTGYPDYYSDCDKWAAELMEESQRDKTSQRYQLLTELVLSCGDEKASVDAE